MATKMKTLTINDVTYDITDDSAVSFVEEQHLTEAQKAVARKNIGAQPVGEYLTEVPEGYAKNEDIKKVDRKVDTLREVVSKFHSNIVEDASGDVIILNDASDLELAGLRIFGKTEQRTTTGKNLLSGFTGTKENPYSITASTDDYIRHVPGTAVSLEEGTTYTLSVYTDGTCGVEAGEDTVEMYLLKDEGYDYFVSSIDAVQVGNRFFKTFTAKQGGVFTVRLDVNQKGATHKFWNAQVEIGSSVTDFEPYTGGIPSPSPDYPQALESLGASVTVTVCGKNLLSTKVEDYTGMTAEVFDGRNCLSWLDDGTNFTYERDFPENTPLTFTLTLYNPGSTHALFHIYYTDGSRIQIVFLPGWSTHKAITDSNKTVSRLCGSWYDSKRLRLDLGSSQIEIGTNATTCEPYKEIQTLTAQTPNGLPGIPVSSGGNYTDSTGQQWICDEIDFARGKYVQRVWKQTFTQNNNYHMQQDMIVRGYTAKISIEGGAVICTHLPSNGMTNRFYSVAMGWNGQQICFCNFTTVDDFKAVLGDGGMEVLYELATPIETDLTAEEIAQYSALHTNYPNTTVYNDAGAGMGVKYVADTKKYVDKKFAELSAALLNN